MSGITEGQLWAWMMDGNYPVGYPDMDNRELVALHRRAYATLSRDVKYLETKTVIVQPKTVRRGKGFRQPANNKTKANQWWKKGNRQAGPVEREVETVKVLEKGSRVNVVMASRMGDVGVTPHLEADRGYVIRFDCVENEFMEQIRKPQGILIDIEPVEDPRPDKVEIAFPEGAKAPQDYTEKDING